MAGIQTGIELQDHLSGILYGIVNSVNLAVSSMYDMQEAMNADVDVSSLEYARNEINQVGAALAELNERMSESVTPTSDAPIVPDAPAPVEIPVQWNTDGLEVFTNTGLERFEQEVQSANSMLEQLSSTQDAIARQAYNTNLFPIESFQDFNRLAVRIDNVRERIQQIEDNPLNLGTDAANAEMEQLRHQLDRMVQEQNELNSAMQDMDVSAANDAYLRLSQLVGETERHIRDNVDEQGRFNEQIQEGAQQASELTDMIKNAVMAYASIQSIGETLELSDELTQVTARLDMMNDMLQMTDELTNMVYAAAQDARGSFFDMADVVARFGNNAKDAFGSTEEVIAFANLIQKQMTIAGASAQEASNAMLQLSQALGSGVLRGDELNSIFEQAPNLIQSIADYLDVPIGQIREMASEGQLSADVVKAAIFTSADEINAKFSEMPMTWGQIWTSFQNTALIAFRPVLQRLNEIANSEAFQTFVDGAVEAMGVLSGVVSDIFDLVETVGGFIADNWSIIRPIVYGVAAALAVYYGWQLLCAVATGIMSVAQAVLNAVMYGNPIMLIIMLVIALIAIIFAVCNAIAKLTGVANSGFGVITGGINVVNKFFENLLFSVLNIVIGLNNAFDALTSNLMTAFHNAICSVQSWWYDLLSTVLNVVAGICEALNKLPFVEFDYSGITSAADEYAAKAAEAAGNKEDYESVTDAFNEGFHTFDTFQDGWVSDAFNAGASWGDGVSEKVSDFFSNLFRQDEIPNPEDYAPSYDFDNTGTAGDINDIAGNTGNIADAMDITQEDLKYLRDIAEQDAINKFTTAEIKLEQTNYNTVNSGDDIDGFVSKLTDSVNEAIGNMTEGVHK